MTASTNFLQRQRVGYGIRRWVDLAVLVIFCLGGAGELLAAEPAPGATPSPLPLSGDRKLTWKAPNTWDYVSLGLTGVTGIAINLAVPPPPARWKGGILFDDSVRSAFMIQSSSGRDAADTISYVTLGTAFASPFVLDAIIYSGIVYSDKTKAFRTAIIALQAFALNLAINEPVKWLVGRARPYTVGCDSDPRHTQSCGSSDANRSFFSGHSSTSFTAAGLLCRNHLGLQYAPTAGQDVAVCVSGLAVAAATAVLRVNADRHYFSDVLVGAGVGFAIGYLYPPLIYSTENAEEKRVAWLVHPAGGDGIAVRWEYRL